VKFLLTFMRLTLATLAILAAACSGTHSSPPPETPPPPGSGLSKVNHIIVVMMENHSFDNYFGALAYAPESPYHTSGTGCAMDDHGCVDGLMCRSDSSSALVCSDSNPEDSGSGVAAFHDTSRCVVPDLDHSWLGSHREANFSDPNAALLDPLNDGFVRVNDASQQPDSGGETPAEDSTMGFYTQDDLPFYYDLAGKFAIDDRYFSSVMGPTLPNRFYLMAATSFGHVDTGDSTPPGATKPITGTILDLLDSAGVSWTDYFQEAPQAEVFRKPTGSATDPHFQSVQTFLATAAGSSGVAQLPQVSFVDPGFSGPDENDDHPPTDIQRGQVFVSQIVNALRNGPYWRDSVIFITYDEHGGFYDHVAPPRAPQGSARTPDEIFPGQCADLSNPPASQQPGGGAGCLASVPQAQLLCPALAQDPNGAYPGNCASFDQLGFRVPFLAVSPFAKPHYVSHTIGDHASILAFIEQRFLTTGSGAGTRAHLTLRDQYADTLADLFDFENAPSLNTPVIQAQSPVTDCTPVR
jgi:phospholipase C